MKRPLLYATLCAISTFGPWNFPTHSQEDFDGQRQPWDDRVLALAVDDFDTADDRDVPDSGAADDVELSDGGVQCVAIDDCAPANEEPKPWTARAKVTAYCLQGRMRSGRYVYVGAIATDRRYIPEGSLVEIEGLGGRYVSEDTGSGVIGWHVDLYMPSCRDAINWGVRNRAIRVARWGW